MDLTLGQGHELTPSFEGQLLLELSNKLLQVFLGEWTLARWEGQGLSVLGFLSDAPAC